MCVYALRKFLVPKCSGSGGQDCLSEDCLSEDMRIRIKPLHCRNDKIMHGKSSDSLLE